MKELRIIEASGTHYDVGFKIGRETKKEIIERIKTTNRVKSDNKRDYEKFLRYFQKYPSLIEEMKGMAEGAGVKFEDLAKLNIVELDKSIKDERCSTFVVMEKEKILIGHNEDGGPTDDIFLFRGEFENGMKITSLCYFGLILGSAVTINSRGFALICNSLNSNDLQFGEPRRLITRRLIESKSIDEAKKIICETKRAQGQNYLLFQNGEIVNIESSARKTSTKKIHSNFFHCNNYLEREMKIFENKEPNANTFWRSHESEKKCPDLTSLKEIREVLSFHKKGSHTFCFHGIELNHKYKTLASVFLDYSERKLYVGYGPTCKSNLQEIELNFDWK